MSDHPRSRREVIGELALGAATLHGLTSSHVLGADVSKSEGAALRVATFSADATVPVGHPLCGGFCPPAVKIVDPLNTHGVVLIPKDEMPVVLCAVDWCWLRGAAYDRWREALAKAAGTTTQRVALHTVHQHAAPIADPDTDRYLDRTDVQTRTIWPEVIDRCIEDSASAAAKAMQQNRAVTHLGFGQAKVEKVAGNRRILGPDGKVAMWRGSSCTDPEIRAQPEGLIDPWLKCIAFYDNDTPLASLQYYATHPMSYYRDGGVSADFCGLARRRLREESKLHHVYFTGCAGDVAAGKYNDGSPEMRPVLTERMYEGMRRAYESAHQHRVPFESLTWKCDPVLLPVRKEYTRDYFRAKMMDSSLGQKDRVVGALGLTWWDRHDAGRTIDITALHLNHARIVHLPGESLIRYQLHAQKLGEDEAKRTHAKAPFVCTAAYGDLGPSYIPTARAYPEGGYEVDMSFVAPEAEETLNHAMANVIRA